MTGCLCHKLLCGWQTLRDKAAAASYADSYRPALAYPSVVALIHTAVCPAGCPLIVQLNNTQLNDLEAFYAETFGPPAGACLWDLLPLAASALGGSVGPGGWVILQSALQHSGCT